ncbi:MAG: glycosyltransferase family 2 protein [Candidatus Hodarchaeota archaeon]
MGFPLNEAATASRLRLVLVSQKKHFLFTAREVQLISRPLDCTFTRTQNWLRNVMRIRSVTAIVLVSSSRARFVEWLSYSWCSLKGTRLILVPFGSECDDIRMKAPKEAEICHPTEDTSLEANRNTALAYLASLEHPEFVAFLDDDTFTDQGWLNAMLDAATANPTTAAFASKVRSFCTGTIQSCGHILEKAAPHDLGLKDGAIGTPMCPCGNCAFVRWSAIQRIREVDSDCWDPRFQQWQTCFDFGLKLVLTGSTTDLVHEATAQHQGYMTWDEKEKEKRKNTAPIRQLRSRFLLYRKFLPENLVEQVRAQMKEREERWQKTGYPGFKNLLKGSEISSVMESAWGDADTLWHCKPDKTWKNLMTKHPNASAIWGF